MKKLLTTMYNVKCRMYNIGKKLLAIFVVVCFFTTSVCRDAIAVTAMPTMNAEQYKKIFTDFLLPYGYGKISRSHFAGTDRVVINIQDLHCHPQVQKSISDIIEMFDTKYGVTNVYLEGVYGTLSAKPFIKNLTNPEQKKEILDKLLESGRLTGAEYYSATSNKTEIIKGLEKKGPYLENLKRFGNLIEVQEQISIILQGVERSTRKLKKQYYTRRQFKIEELSKQYIEGKIKAEKYYKLLAKHTAKLGIDLTKYENTFRYMQLLALQGNLNYKAITTQLQTLVFVLKENLPPDAYQILLDNTKNFEDTDRLYSYVIKLSKSFGLDLNVNFKELNKYFNFIELSQKINPLELLKEEELLTREINIRFSDTVAQREVIFLTNFEKYLKDYLTTKITAQDYEYYKENIETYKKLWNKYVDNKVLTLLEPYMVEIDKFYKINTDRNNYFTQNIFKGVKTNKIENIKEDKDEVNEIIENMDKVKRLDIIITGGFHSQTVTDILQDHGVSYIVITPNVQGGVAEAEKTYYEIAKEQKEINFQTLAAMSIFEMYGESAARIAFIRYLKDAGININDVKTICKDHYITSGMSNDSLINDIFDNNNDVFKQEYVPKYYQQTQQESEMKDDDKIDGEIETLFSDSSDKKEEDDDNKTNIILTKPKDLLGLNDDDWAKLSEKAKNKLKDLNKNNNLENKEIKEGIESFIKEAIENDSTVYYDEKNGFYYKKPIQKGSDKSDFVPLYENSKVTETIYYYNYTTNEFFKNNIKTKKVSAKKSVLSTKKGTKTFITETAKNKLENSETPEELQNVIRDFDDKAKIEGTKTIDYDENKDVFYIVDVDDEKIYFLQKGRKTPTDAENETKLFREPDDYSIYSLNFKNFFKHKIKEREMGIIDAEEGTFWLKTEGENGEIKREYWRYDGVGFKKTDEEIFSESLADIIDTHSPNNKPVNLQKQKIITEIAENIETDEYIDPETLKEITSIVADEIGGVSYEDEIYSIALNAVNKKERTNALLNFLKNIFSSKEEISNIVSNIVNSYSSQVIQSFFDEAKEANSKVKYNKEKGLYYEKNGEEKYLQDHKIFQETLEQVNRETLSEVVEDILLEEENKKTYEELKEEIEDFNFSINRNIKEMSNNFYELNELIKKISKSSLNDDKKNELRKKLESKVLHSVKYGDININSLKEDNKTKYQWTTISSFVKQISTSKLSAETKLKILDIIDTKDNDIDSIKLKDQIEKKEISLVDEILESSSYSVKEKLEILNEVNLDNIDNNLKKKIELEKLKLEQLSSVNSLNKERKKEETNAIIKDNINKLEAEKEEEIKSKKEKIEREIEESPLSSTDKKNLKEALNLKVKIEQLKGERTFNIDAETNKLEKEIDNSSLSKEDKKDLKEALEKKSIEEKIKVIFDGEKIYKVNIINLVKQIEDSSLEKDARVDLLNKIKNKITVDENNEISKDSLLLSKKEKADILKKIDEAIEKLESNSISGEIGDETIDSSKQQPDDEKLSSEKTYLEEIDINGIENRIENAKTEDDIDNIKNYILKDEHLTRQQKEKLVNLLQKKENEIKSKKIEQEIDNLEIDSIIKIEETNASSKIKLENYKKNKDELSEEDIQNIESIMKDIDDNFPGESSQKEALYEKLIKKINSEAEKNNENLLNNNNALLTSTYQPAAALASVFAPYIKKLELKIANKQGFFWNVVKWILPKLDFSLFPVIEEQIFGKLLSVGLFVFIASNPFGWMTGFIAFGLLVIGRLALVLSHSLVEHKAGADKDTIKQNLKTRLQTELFLTVPYTISIFSGGIIDVNTATLISTLIHIQLNFKFYSLEQNQEKENEEKKGSKETPSIVTVSVKSVKDTININGLINRITEHFAKKNIASEISNKEICLSWEEVSDEIKKEAKEKGKEVRNTRIGGSKETLRGGVIIGSITVKSEEGENEEHLIRLKIKGDKWIFYSNTIELNTVENIKEIIEDLMDKYYADGIINNNFGKNTVVAFADNKDGKLTMEEIELSIEHKKTDYVPESVEHGISLPYMISKEEIEKYFTDYSKAKEYLDMLKNTYKYTSFCVSEELYSQLPDGIKENEDYNISKEITVTNDNKSKSEAIKNMGEKGVTFKLEGEWELKDIKDLKEKCVEEKGINIDINIKIESEDTFNKLNLQSIDFYQETGMILMLDIEEYLERKINIKGKIGLFRDKDNKNEISTEKIEQIIKTQADVVCIEFNETLQGKLNNEYSNKVNGVINFIEKIKNIKSPQYRYNTGKDKALSSQMYKLNEDKEVEDIVVELKELLEIDINDFENEQVAYEIVKILDSDLLNDKAKSYIETRYIAKGNYIEALGFIRGVVENTLVEEISNILFEDNKEATENFKKEIKTNENQAILILTIQALLKDKKLRDLYTQQGGSDTLSAKAYIESIREKLNLNLDEILRMNEYKILIPKEDVDFQGIPELLIYNNVKGGTVDKAIDNSILEIKAILIAA